MKSENREPKTKLSVSEKEQETQQFWATEKIFEQSLEQTKNGKPFIFYDGPPFATGLPHYGHLVPGTIKDIIPRYQTMKGRFVRRKWGWDCHGLPIENLIEDELGLENKADVIDYGVEKFNQAACDSVLRYDKEWKEIVPRMGRWIDMEDSYKTMDWQYSETIWWVFKMLWDKGYIYEGYKSMHICPRCETTLSNNEVADGYKDIKDISVTAKFELVDEPGTYVLAWTTTPWTLPGNVALAVGNDITYVKVKTDDGRYILARDRLVDIMKDIEYAELETFKGRELLGKDYTPLFDYYTKDVELKNHLNGWKIYAADFVTTEDGTGVVHIAPAFGEDDMNLGKLEDLPFIQHVTMSGHFKDEVKNFAGMLVKPKDNKSTGVDHMATDIEIVKYLAHEGLLFAKVKYEHSYPHCWRCKTPLLNYATNSWFVKVTDYVDKLIKENEDINWVPANIKEGRFGNWLEGARDWAISRSRFWGAPFPVWRDTQSGEMIVVGSVEELQDKMALSGNNYTLMRHGQADSNVEEIISSQVENDDHLTEAGKDQVKEAASDLKKQKIDMIFVSPFARTRETAEIIASELGLSENIIVVDERIKEPDFGDFNGKPTNEYHTCFTSDYERFVKNCSGGENLMDVKRRVGEFLYDIEQTYKNKNILIVSHDYPSWLMQAVVQGLDARESATAKDDMHLNNADHRTLSFRPLPHNRDFELDLHRPYIDEVTLMGEGDTVLERIPDVFDCWFESGSMPYAQLHYPFENKDTFEAHFPADFIAEGVDQTRGWFYNMLVLSTGVFGEAAFKNVIVNGVILAEDGQKMSKSLKNYPDPMLVVEKYGADALRYYLMSSPVVRAEALNFSEKGVGEVYRKVIVRFENVLSFYEMYMERQTGPASGASTHLLDKWILSRLGEVQEAVSGALERYEVDRATRPIGEFVDDLSTWYLRRSRTRIKNGGEDMQAALATLQYILREFAKITAPFMPFVAERIYVTVKRGSGKESVHLESWPDAVKKDTLLLENMEQVRSFASRALMLRAEKGIKVRQPLAKLTVELEGNPPKEWEEYAQILKDEVNVKEVIVGDIAGDVLELTLELTPELVAEGQFRELVRNIQALRKKTDLTPEDIVTAHIETNDQGRNLIQQFEKDLKKTTLLKDIVFEKVDDTSDIVVEDLVFEVKFEK